MKRMILKNNYAKHSDIYAMGVVNNSHDDKVIVKVYEGGKEGRAPHVHVTFDDGNMCCISLTKAEYAKHHDDLPKLHGNDKKKFISVMSSPCNAALEDAHGVLKKGNGYQYAVYIWVRSHENGSYEKFNIGDDGLPIMPDYSKL